MLASFVAFLDGSVVNLALPAIGRDLGGGLALQQWVIDGYLLALGALILVAGAVSDQYGRLRVLRAGLGIFAGASLLCAVAPTGWVLVAARCLQGVGAAFLVPSSLAMINSRFSGARQASAIGTWTAWTGTAFVVGPPLGGVLVDALSWRWVFGLNVVPVAVTLYLTTKLAPRAAASGTRARIDVVGAVLAAVGLSATVYALIEVQRLGLVQSRRPGRTGVRSRVPGRLPVVGTSRGESDAAAATCSRSATSPSAIWPPCSSTPRCRSARSASRCSCRRRSD